MHIIVDCPECQSRFQLHADLRGRRIRCPNSACRAAFIVQEAAATRPVERATPPPEKPAARRPRDTLPTGTAGDVFDWRSAPPPVQGVAADAPPAKTTAARPEPKPRPSPVIDDPKPRGYGRITVLFLLLAFGFVLGGVWYYVRAAGRAEDTLRAEAEADYAAGKFHVAAGKYRTLSEKFGGTRGPEYRLLAELSDVRDLAAGTDPEAGLVAAEQFADKNVRDPAFQPHRTEIGAAALALAAVFADSDAGPAYELGVRAVDLARRFSPAGGDIDAVRAKLDRAKDDRAAAARRRANVDEVVKLLQREKPDIPAAALLAARYRVADDAAVVAARREAEARVYRPAAYQPLNQPAGTAAPPEGPPSLLLEPLESAPKPGATEIVLAVARGLLTAHDGRDGRRLWAARVGLDAGELPVRVAGRDDDPELVVVAATDPPGLTARDLRTGAVRWHQTLDAPALGRPALSGGRLYVATTGPRGLVYDFDARGGLLRGRFEVGQPLAAGAAFDATTARLFVPARGQFVYVFGYPPAAEPRCEGLLPTDHAPGSLRGEPIVVSGEEGVEVPRYLVLGVADGLDAMKLRAFRLLDKPSQSAAQAEVRLPGWSWFPPYHDPEKLVLVTDTGAVGLFGIHGAGTSDPPIFPLLGRDPPAAGDRSPARGLLAHAEEFGFWSLAGGTVQHWRLGLTREQGRVLKQVWPDGPRLGSPLHAAQVSRDRSTLYLVAQTASPPATYLSAVAMYRGRVVWQRPLGLSPQGDPLTVGGAAYVLDASGAIDRFDPAKHPASDAPWQSGGRRVAQPLADVVGTPMMMRTADGRGAVSLACRSASGELRLVVRRFGDDGDVRETSLRVASPIGGTPAVAATAAVVPLADGTLCYASFDGDRAEDGPNWRPLGGSPESRGHVLPWGTDYLVSDGGRRLLSLRWPAGQKFDLDVKRPLELAARVVGVPVVLPGAEPAAAVADASGTLTLVRGATPRAVRSWKLDGPVTAGPWAVGGHVACVVARKTLAWIDPEKDGVAWTWTTPGDGIEFAPLLDDGRLIVGDAAGLFASLDAATGSPRGEPFRHPAEVAPASAVAPFGPGRLFAPLTDGSALLLTP